MRIIKILTPIIVRGISPNTYNISKLVKIKIYFRGSNRRSISLKSTLIKRELHLIDDLSTKILISINIIKPKSIIINLRRDTIIIGAY